MRSIKKLPIILAVFALFIVPTFISPNPYGDNPDAIADESYFLTSSLSAIEKKTLPGWEFSPSGNYYGGAQTYIDTIVMLPTLGFIMAMNNFSIVDTKMWVALNTGDLLHVLRTINGLLALFTIVGGYLYFSRKKIPQELSNTLLLFLFLLMSNVLVVQFFHTAKVWTLYILITAIISALFIANEYYRTHFNETLIPKSRFATILIWGSIIMFFQTYVGAISIFLILMYALLLNHLKIQHVIAHLKKYWYLIALFTLTQISFIYRAIFINWASGSFSEISAMTAERGVDWSQRIINPLIFTLKSHPLAVLLFTLGAIGIMVGVRKKTLLLDAQKKLYVGIALMHPFIVYLIFHIGIGFSLAPRYGIFMTLAISFSTTILLGMLNKTIIKIAIALCALLYVIIGFHAITLYWNPSSETILLQKIEKDYNSPKNVFAQGSDAVRLTLPVNTESLDALGEKRKNMGRFSFMLNHADLVREKVSFKPVTIVTYNNAEMRDAIARFTSEDKSVWVISTQCSAMCTEREVAEGSCFAVSARSCGMYPNEINELPVFLSIKQLGYAYIARLVQSKSKITPQ